LGIKLNTNVHSLRAQRSLREATQSSARSIDRLASGNRINTASDDAAGLSISEKLKASISSSKMAMRNSNDAISVVQVADGAMNVVSSLLIRMRELAIQSASDTYGNQERLFINKEYQAIKKEIQRTADTTKAGGFKLLDGKKSFIHFQVGIKNDDFGNRLIYKRELVNANLSYLGIQSKDITTAKDARSSLRALDQAIGKVSLGRTEIGAVITHLRKAINNLHVSEEGLTAANSRIRDADFADETANNVKSKLLTTMSTDVLAQANNLGSSILGYLDKSR
jgi:flagellin